MDKSKLLWAVFFTRLERDEPVSPEHDYPANFNFKPITNEQIHRVIVKLSTFKAPGLDSIPNIFLTCCTHLLVPHLGPIY